MIDAESAGAAERMDRIYRTQRLIYDVTRRHYLLGRVALLKGLAPPPDGHVLEIGCGTAWNLIRAAGLYPDARFYGLDVSSAMLDTARRAIARRHLVPRIRLTLADATDFDAVALFGRAGFDRVLISYALSMIPGWERAVALAAGAVGEGGSLHIVDFGACEGLPRAFTKLLHTWLAQFSVTPRLDLELALARLASAQGLELAFSPLHRGYAVHAVLTRPAVDAPARRFAAAGA